MDPVDRYFLKRDEKIAKLVRRGRVPKIDWTKPLPPKHVDLLYDGGIPPSAFKKSRVYAALKVMWKGKKERWTAEGCLKGIEEWARAASEAGGPREVADALDAILYRLHVLSAINAGNTVYTGPTARNPCFGDPKNIYEKLGHPELWIHYKAAHLNCSAWYILRHGLEELPTEERNREEYIRFCNSDTNPEYVRFKLINQLHGIREYLSILPDARRMVTPDLLGRIEERAKEEL